jgi:hypothetical protein
MNSYVFCVLTRSKVVLNRRFGTKYRSHLQGRCCPRRYLRWDRYVVPKRRFQTTLRSVITQKTEEFNSGSLSDANTKGRFRLSLNGETAARQCVAVSTQNRNVKCTENLINMAEWSAWWERLTGIKKWVHEKVTTWRRVEMLASL